MSKYFLLLFAVLVAGLAGCSKDPRVLQMEREIKGVAHQYWTAFVNNDVKTMKKLLIKEEAREINREDFKDQGDMNFSISLGKVEIKGRWRTWKQSGLEKKRGG